MHDFKNFIENQDMHLGEFLFMYCTVYANLILSHKIY